MSISKKEIKLERIYWALRNMYRLGRDHMKINIKQEARDLEALLEE